MSTKFPNKAKLPKPVLYLAILIIVAGAIVGAFSAVGSLKSATHLAPASQPVSGAVYGTSGQQWNIRPGKPNYQSGRVLQSLPSATETATATRDDDVYNYSFSPSSTVNTAQNQQNGGTEQSNTQSGANNSNPTSAGFLEFFSNVTLQVAAPSSTMQKVSAVAYSLGGYVAYSYAENSSALAVVRVPAVNYQSALAQIEGLGNVTFTSSTSNDVTVQYH